MREGGRRVPTLRLLLAAALLATLSGCATARRLAPTADLRPCSDGYAITADGWRLGIRHIRPEHPDPNKLPVVLCHGMGLNATFWTITDDHLPGQLAARGYDVFLFDLRGSGESAKIGAVGAINEHLRQTIFLEIGEKEWNIDQVVMYDVPAVLDFVKAETGHDRVNWIGHSLGGMLAFPYLELSSDSWRIANLVAMGATISFEESPQWSMLRANRSLRVLASVASTGRLGRPLKYVRFPGLSLIDQFYFTPENVDERTVSRFYGNTLEDTGWAVLKQLDPYLEYGHFLSADRSIDYAARLGEITTPTLMVAGEADIMSDVPSTRLTYESLGSKDKTMVRFGRPGGQRSDYGHCDLIWSRYAPAEVFPVLIDWLDKRQPAAPLFSSPQVAPGP